MKKFVDDQSRSLSDRFAALQAHHEEETTQLYKQAALNKKFKGKRFYLQRNEDVSGLSGTGIVAEGIEFINGLVALSWLSPHPGVIVYPSMRQIEELHGHEGKTLVVWVD